MMILLYNPLFNVRKFSSGLAISLFCISSLVAEAETPTESLVTVVQHHSFVKLPDSNYKPRAFDTRSGAISMSYMDYATPIQESITKRFVIRHRLEKKEMDFAVILFF